MKPTLSPVTFALAYCVSYVVTLSQDWPLFRYYPLTGAFTWGWHRLTDSGPAMAWYGLMASSVCAGVIVAAAVPERWVVTTLRNYLWIVPAAGLVGCVFLMRIFFIR